MNQNDVTSIELERFVYTWSVENFKFYPCRAGDIIKSPSFYSGFDGEFKWKLFLYPNGLYDEQPKEYVALKLHPANALAAQPEIMRNMRLILSLLGSYGREEDQCFHEQDSPSGVLDTYFHNFVEKSYILDEKNCLLPNGRLTIKCEMYHFYGDITNGSVHLSCPLPVDDAKCQPQVNDLCNDFERLLNAEDFADVKLIIGDKELLAHKNVLSVRSRVFAAMFAHKMKEEKENLVKIDDVDYAVMLEVLRFIYAGKVNDLKTMAKDLLAAADKYELEGLKTLCQNSLIQEVNFENVVELMGFADYHGADALKKAAIDFVAGNVKKLQDSKKFQNEMKSLSHLLGEMLDVLVSTFQ